MYNHGLRKFFSFLLAVMMVCTLLPATIFAEEDVQPAATEQTLPPSEEAAPSAEEEAVVLDEETAEDALQKEEGIALLAADKTCAITLNVTSYAAPFLSGSTHEHTVSSIKVTEYVKESAVGSSNASGSATARFVGSNESGWTLCIDLVVGNYTKTITTNARITNKDMSNATGTITFGASFNQTNPSISTSIHISGGKDLPQTAPAKPTEDELKGALDAMPVLLYCTTEKETRGSYALALGQYEVSDPVKSGNAYTCTLTVYAEKYLDRLNSSVSLQHELADSASKSVTLTYNNTSKKWTAAATSVTFNIQCTPETYSYSVVHVYRTNGQEDGRTDPVSYSDIASGTVVSADDIAKAPEYNGNTYDYTSADPESATITDNSVTFTLYYDRAVEICTITYTDGVDDEEVFADQVYTAEVGAATPAFAGDIPTREGYKFAGWDPAVADTVTETATYTAKWEKEEEPVVTYTVTYKDGSDGKVFADDVHTDLKAGDATPAFVGGTPTREGYKFAGWDPAVADTVTASVTYTAKWEKEETPVVTYTVTYKDGADGKVFADDVHTDLKAGDKTPVFVGGTPTREGYKFAGWDPAVADTVTASVTYTAKWEKEETPVVTYTVTYKDGADGKVFADDVHTDLKAGDKTPAFTGGTPTREGYKFVGWDPEVADTVSATVTYTAKWEKEETPAPTYTVTYKDGVNGKVFADDVHTGLKAGEKTPAFSGGTPKRNGYTFTGWTPKVSDTVTTAVTYTATWKSTNTSGKDDVYKTGDNGILLILSSILVISFCGAAAVFFFDRKRKKG